LELAAKKSLENLITSFIIFFDKPFFTADTVKVNGITGKIEKIGLRSTRIRTIDKTLITVLNKQMVDSIVDNLSMRTKRRAEISLELSTKTTLSLTQTFIDLLKKLLEQNN
jgi:MscS family membrane protein